MKRKIGNTTIITNNHDYFFVYWHELTEKERKQFDYVDSIDKQDSFVGFRYKGNTYDLDEFMNLHNHFYEPNPPVEFKGYDGYLTDSFFSGILIKLDTSNESVKVATFYS